jgi:hypothetical protein
MEEKGKQMTAYIMMKMWYPNDKADEVGKAFIKFAASLPKMLKRLAECPWVYADENGYMTYNLFELEEGKLFEALRELNKYVANYRTVAGLRYKIEPILTAKDALPMIGLQPPALK